MAVLQGLVRVSSSSPPSGWRSPTLSVTSVLFQCLSRWPASSSLHTFPSIAALLKRAMWQCSSPLAALVEIPHCHGSGQWQTLVTSYKMVRTSCSQLDGHSSHHLSRADRIITFLWELHRSHRLTNLAFDWWWIWDVFDLCTNQTIVWINKKLGQMFNPTQYCLLPQASSVVFVISSPSHLFGVIAGLCSRILSWGRVRVMGDICNVNDGSL